MGWNMRELFIKLGFPLGILLFIGIFTLVKRIKRRLTAKKRMELHDDVQKQKAPVDVFIDELRDENEKEDVWKKWNEASKG